MWLWASPMLRSFHLMSGMANGGSGWMEPFCPLGRDHQRHVAVENRSADGIGGGGDVYRAGGHRLLSRASAANPVMVIVAGDFTLNRLIFSQVSASGFHVRAAVSAESASRPRQPADRFRPPA